MSSPNEKSKAAFLSRMAQAARNREPSGIPQRAPGPAPLSFAQQRLWFLDQFQPGSPAYNLASTTRMEGRLDLAALTGAVQDLMARHEVLRTTFASNDGQPVQIVRPEMAAPVTYVDLTDRTGELDGLVEAEVLRPFDLGSGPLLRITLFRLAPEIHMLLTVMHHIVTDGWSNGIISREVGAFYAARTTGTPALLPPLSVQYADVAMWQREQLSGERLDRLLTFWQRILRGQPPLLELPLDRPRPAVQTHEGAAVEVKLEPSLTERLLAFCQQEGATPYMVMLTALKALLLRYTGQGDLSVGTPVFGRARSEMEGLIGFFANTLVLRNRLERSTSFRAALQQVRQGALEGFSHQEMPFERLVEALAPTREMSHTPLYQVLFSLVKEPEQRAEWPGLTLSVRPLPRRIAATDLTLEVAERPDGLHAAWLYRTDLFDRPTIERLAAHWERLLAAALASPSTTLGALPLMSDSELGVILTDWNATAALVPPGTVVTWIEGQVARTPDATALVHEARTLTYADLNAAANQLAHRLRALGAGPGALVSIHLERSPEMLIALLGVLKAGAAYVPLDPDYPRDRLEYMVTDAQVSALVTAGSLSVAAPGVPVVRLGDSADLVHSESTENPAPAAGPNDPAYVIYTSGSTGRPKGVAVAHRNLANFLTAMQAAPGMAAGDTLLAVTSISFDIAGLELFLPLVTGGRIALASRADAADGRRLAALIGQHGVTMMQATPVTWRLLVDSGWQPPPGFTILTGGEALPPDLADRLVAGGARVYNLYGPTETTIWSATDRVRGGEAPVPIGRGVANTSLYILDPDLQPVPVGATGELFIGGEGVALGYLRQPELTAERFLADPFRPGGSIYRTGDLARYLPDGRVQFLGRVDHQVKIRGHRIELGEIETALAAHPDVTAAVVTAQPGATGVQEIVGYVTAADGISLNPADLRAHLATTLPSYMLPVAFVQLPTLPLTPNGKVNRKALPAPEGQTLRAATAFIAPAGDLEVALAAIWCEVLGQPAVSVQENFFDLGGHSLLLVQVREQVRERLGIHLTVVDLFRFPTIAALAAHLQPGRQTAAPGTAAADRAARARQALEQQRLRRGGPNRE